MFAVPGWSVSADALKPQIDRKASKPSNKDDSRIEKANGAERKSRKRKRGHVEVTQENLGDLWTKHIEQKNMESTNGDGGPAGNKQKKKRKREREGLHEAAMDVDGDGDSESFAGFSEDEDKAEAQEQQEPVTKKKKKGKEKETEDGLANGHVDVAEPTPIEGEDLKGVEDGKAKYENRRAKDAKRREQKALLQADGTLPPSRPDPISHTPTETTAPKKIKSSKEQPSSEKQPQQEIVQPQKASAAPKPPEAPPPARIPDPLAPSAKLTPLQQRMAAKLTSARFRHLNQTLYTSPSDQAMRLFTDSPQAYTSYHAGFRAQVAIWPQNPVEGFIEDIKTRGGISIPSQKKAWRDLKKGKKAPKSDGHSNGNAATNSATPKASLEPLPRSRHGICTIADLGCGDATLASSLLPSKKALNLNLLSFDLAKGDTPNAHLITVADTTNLSAAGVKDGSVEIAICCLSLMGTNWVGVVDECARIVRGGGGEVWVAEIKSRFARAGEVRRGMKDKEKGDGIGKVRKKGGEDGDEGDGNEIVEVEEVGAWKEKEETTDVSAFVEVFAKRGFLLRGEPDVGNKMFVRLRFVKVARGGVGKGGEENEKGGMKRFGEGFKGKQSRRRVGDEGVVVVDEGLVLKPCVYKTR